ncbi:MAG: hypothetical protein M1509_01180 [Nitrospirae bacterium]|jgi:hypothetical protein|uniref:Uncharacterized protein n=1 Tax=Leptospirillum ferrodiazotrophum TaxID=412449 RepID=C6HY93_9BACT|nr:MAG: conserved hypothetical protein [Leptospirillum ferrodiazotrophum]MCL5953108.1 hypothetical protein [Nitrospirota bacterium]
MDCQRCHGKMVEEEFSDLKDDSGSLNFRGWRCLLCGEIVDSVILSNRSHRPTPIVSRNRKIMAYH